MQNIRNSEQKITQLVAVRAFKLKNVFTKFGFFKNENSLVCSYVFNDVCINKSLDKNHMQKPQIDAFLHISRISLYILKIAQYNICACLFQRNVNLFGLGCLTEIFVSAKLEPLNFDRYGIGHVFKAVIFGFCISCINCVLTSCNILKSVCKSSLRLT